jgi:hypothetical protein
MRVSHATMFMLLSFASIARADTVRLRNGRTIENVQVSEEGKTLRLTSDHGSILVPSSEVLEVVPRALRLEELADRRRAAGDDPAALRALATWCAQSGFPREERDLLALARGIELDRDLEAIRSTAMPAPFVALARRMKRGGYSTSEREFVLRQALARDPESAEARRALQEVERDAQLERAVLARAADASGRAPRTVTLSSRRSALAPSEPRPRRRSLARRPSRRGFAPSAPPPTWLPGGGDTSFITPGTLLTRRVAPPSSSSASRSPGPTIVADTTGPRRRITPDATAQATAAAITPVTTDAHGPMAVTASSKSTATARSRPAAHPAPRRASGGPRSTRRGASGALAS